MNVNLKTRTVGNLRKIVKVDESNTPTGEEFNVLVEEAQGNVLENGTPITEELLNSINWRDETVILKNLETNVLPNALVEQTQIVGLLDGSIWIVPKMGLGDAFKIENVASFITSVKDNEPTEYTNYKTGIKVTNGMLEVLNAQEATKDLAGNYHGDKGVVTVIQENGLKINSGVLKINRCSGVTSDSENRHGTVQVIQGNGLKLNKGTIKMNKVDSSNAGAIPVEDYQALKGFSEGILTTNLNGCINNGLYYGTNASNAPTSNSFVCNVIKNNSVITQTLVDQTNSIIWIRTINDGIIGGWKSVTPISTVLYDGYHTLNAETRLNTGVSIYQQGYRRIRIEVYKEEIDESGDPYSYIYSKHAFTEVSLFDEPGTSDIYENNFSFFTDLNNTTKYWIKGNVKGDSVYLSAYSSPFTSTDSASNHRDSSTCYHIKIIGYKE